MFIYNFLFLKYKILSLHLFDVTDIICIMIKILSNIFLSFISNMKFEKFKNYISILFITNFNKLFNKLKYRNILYYIIISKTDI